MACFDQEAPECWHMCVCAYGSVRVCVCMYLCAYPNKNSSVLGKQMIRCVAAVSPSILQYFCRLLQCFLVEHVLPPTAGQRVLRIVQMQS